MVVKDSFSLLDTSPVEGLSRQLMKLYNESILFDELVGGIIFSSEQLIDKIAISEMIKNKILNLFFNLDLT